MPGSAAELTHTTRLRPPRRGKARGFTLLEAIVAIAIVGIAIITIVTFVSQMVGALTRAGDVNAQNLAKQAIIEVLEPLNPLEQPNGEDQIGDLALRWESENVVPPNTATRVGTGLSGFSMGFYNVTVSVDRADRKPWFSFAKRKVGYRRMGAGSLPGFSQ
jgi:general secretion pathway protein I